MGMFDYVIFVPEFQMKGFRNEDKELEFQTKDTPAQQMCTYTVSKDFRLIDEEGGDVNFEGSLNILGGAYPKYRQYTLLFIEGTLSSLEEDYA